MKFVSDYFSILCFFITWLITKSIYKATVAGIIASGIQLAFMAIKYRRFKPIQWTGGVFLTWVVFGGLTLIFHNPLFIQWKVTVVYWLIALALLASHFWKGDLLYKKMLKDKIELPEHAWAKLNASWFIFFAVMGAVNLFVAYHFSQKVWMYFKFIGLLGITFIFAIGQAFYLHKHMLHEEIATKEKDEQKQS